MFLTPILLFSWATALPAADFFACVISILCLMQMETVNTKVGYFETELERHFIGDLLDENEKEPFSEPVKKVSKHQM